MQRRTRTVLLTTLAPTIAIAAAAIWWSTSGPRPEREAARLADLLHVRPGSVIADIGAGNGKLAVEMARRVGPSGRVYATEIEKGKVDAIADVGRAAGVRNLVPMLGTESATGLPDSCCDVIYLRRVYHHFNQAAAMNRAIYRALRPGGRLAVVDFLSPRWLFFRHRGIPRSDVMTQLESAGFVAEQLIDRWSPIDYCLVFHKKADPAPEEPSSDVDRRDPRSRLPARAAHPAQEPVHIFERGEQSREAAVQSRRAATARPEVARPKRIGDGDHSRSHRLVLVRALYPGNVLIQPERESH